jgi:hypothetical protein
VKVDRDTSAAQALGIPSSTEVISRTEYGQRGTYALKCRSDSSICDSRTDSQRDRSPSMRACLAGRNADATCCGVCAGEPRSTSLMPRSMRSAQNGRQAVSSWLTPFCREFGAGPVCRFRSFAVTGWSSQLLCGPLHGFACFTWHHDEVAHIPERVTPSRAAPWRIHTVGDSMSGFGAVVVVACAVRAPDAPLGSVRLANLFRQQD